MSTRNLIPLLAAAALGCHDSSGGGAQSFDALVTGLIQDRTSDATDPVEVGTIRFVFSEDATAFDDVLPPDLGPLVEQ
jgi:hypothetical protein